MRAIFLILLLLTACTLHPPYERPSFASTETWRTPLPVNNLADVEWWKQLGDPVLDTLIDEALANNQNLLVAVSRVDQFRAQLGIARSKLYPQLEANGIADRLKISPAITPLAPGSSIISNAFALSFKASYLVDIWGEVRSSTEAAYHEWLASIQARRTTVLGLVSSVASTYIQLRQFDEQLFIADETWKDRQEAYDQAKIRFELGLTSQMEVEQALSELEIVQVEVQNLKIAIAESENLLSFLIGKPSGTITRGRSLEQLAMIPAIPSYLPSDIVNQRPDLCDAEEKLIAANARIGVAKAKFFPQISLTGAYGAESLELADLLKNSSRVWSYGATLLQEIFTGGRLTSGVQLARARQQEALHNYLSIILNAFKEVNDALTSHKIHLELVETQRLRTEALQRYLTLSNLRYKEGETDYLNFLDAERQLFQAQLDYAAAKGNSFLSLVQIYEAIGGPWVTHADAQEHRDLNR